MKIWKNALHVHHLNSLLFACVQMFRVDQNKNLTDRKAQIEVLQTQAVTKSTRDV